MRVYRWADQAQSKIYLMFQITIFFIATSIVLTGIPVEAKTKRSNAVKHEFQRLNPCPLTGEHRGKCPGYVIDHRIALCVGGADVANNMRWQTVKAAKSKDRWECKLDWQRHLAACERAGCFDSNKF